MFLWLVIGFQITDPDEGALKYLKDIKWCRIYNPKGFKIDFYFDINHFFNNSVVIIFFNQYYTQCFVLPQDVWQ